MNGPTDVSSTNVSDDQANENQAQRAYRLIEEMIVTLKLPPGSKLSEATLSKKLQLGKTPIREALQRLSFEGTIDIVPRSGAYVSEIDVADQLGMIEVRRGIENVLAGRSARLATDEARQAFRRLGERFEAAGKKLDSATFISADREFNALVSECAKSKYASHAIGPIEAQTRRFWYLHFQRFGDLKKVCRLHANVCHQIAEGNETAARNHSDKLMDYVESYTRRTLAMMTETASDTRSV